MCLCDNSTVTEARGILCETDTNKKEDNQPTVSVLRPHNSPFKRKGPAPTRLCQKRVAQAPENVVPSVFKRARTRAGAAVETNVAHAKLDILSSAANSVKLPDSPIVQLMCSGVQNREDLLRELIALRKKLALPPKKRMCKGF
mmetsp:Transcript_37140/g.80859  ORF Transcript_37140/g.80859 Transcript_37140/m.80859 type:complete len:143 (-) Transcript_37140:495-923(-)|eukprot:CAMPEP_0118923178 /NCGR_PEP_ID=MMETSP1169-20130426/1800_1 /TAXON_ID=36882 /ORGANISM="Pyramimonas obovata, Strain CCMP722" /LENGTH=142 /DNA_ID=CAMNT_0006864129 /DNA_START=138 /DNA_END=566 /DNA_ORIENTATION=-